MFVPIRDRRSIYLLLYFFFFFIFAVEKEKMQPNKTKENVQEKFQFSRLRHRSRYRTENQIQFINQRNDQHDYVPGCEMSDSEVERGNDQIISRVSKNQPDFYFSPVKCKAILSEFFSTLFALFCPSKIFPER